MSNRRRPRRPSCPCGAFAEHTLVMPDGPEGPETQPGYQVVSCSDCWPVLRAAVESHGAVLDPCTCGCSA